MWPVCLTVESLPDGESLHTELAENDIPFVGAGPRAVRFSSKLEYKSALSHRTTVRTPEHVVVGTTQLSSHHLGYPVVIKLDNSCNSWGVDVAQDESDLESKVERLALSAPGSQMFLERWERVREYTVALLPGSKNSSREVAAMEIRLRDSRRGFLDKRAKHTDSDLVFGVPTPDVRRSLQDSTTEIADALGIDGHFRADFVENEAGCLFAIELNFLPFMNWSRDGRSYFPRAMAMSSRLGFVDTVRRIVEAVPE